MFRTRTDSTATRPAVQQRWKELVLRQPDRRLRADYLTLALTFAELVDRQGIWSAALQEFDMTESTFLKAIEDRALQKGLEKGLEKGRKQGLTKGTLVGKIQVLQELLKVSLTPAEQLSEQSEEALTTLLTQLRLQLPSPGNGAS